MVDPFCRKEGVRSNRTPESTAYPRMKVQRDRSMPSKRSKLEGAEGLAPQDSRDTTKAGLLETQFPVAIGTPLDHSASTAGPSRYAQWSTALCLPILPTRLHGAFGQCVQR